MATCYTSYDLSAHTPLATPASIGSIGTCGRSQASSGGAVQSQQKDYSRPLHVDCSVEYELPNQAKPPAGVRNEPLLMIHPCYFRKIESQRRSPFVNNLPTRTSQHTQHTQPHQPHQTTAAAPTSISTSATTASKRRAARGQQLPQQVPQQAAQYPVQYAQHQLWDPMPHLVPNIAATSTPVGAYCANTNNMVTTGHSHSKRQTDTNAMLANINVNLNVLGANCGSYANTSDVLAHCWTEPDRSPDRPEHLTAGNAGSGGGGGGGKHILTGKYRQYLRAHRLHPYVASAIPLASTFPQLHQQVCYNV